MAKVFCRGLEIDCNHTQHLPFREKIFVSFDNGKTKANIHKDVNALKQAMDEGVFEFSYLPYSKDYMYVEVIQSDDEVSDDVLNFLTEKAKELKIELNIDANLSIVNHPSVLEWLLKKGAKCKFVSGYGKSTMENFIHAKLLHEEFADECIELLKKYDAVDEDYLKVYGRIWESYAIKPFWK